MLTAITLVWIGVAMGAPQADGDDAAPPPGAERSPLVRDLARGPLVRDLEDERDLLDEHDGFFWQLGLTGVAQQATETLTSRDGLVSFGYDVAGGLRLYGEPMSSEGAISWWVRGGRPIGAPKTSDLSEDIGSLYSVNSNLLNNEIFVQELYWAQYFGDAVAISAGRIDPTFRVDFNRVANDEREQFMDSALVNSASVPFPDPGLGADVRWDVNELLRIRAGVYMANGRANAAPFGDIRADELFWPVQVSLRPTIESLGEGAYRMLVYYTESEGDNGFGFSLSVDQEIGGGIVPFLRFGVDDSDVADFKTFASIGVGIEDAFGRPGDLFGVGFAWGDPTDDTLRDESVVEAFYRLELSPGAAITPDVQFVIDPSANFEDDLIVVFGLRLQVFF